MEEIPDTIPTEQPPTGCANCGNPAILKDYPTALCSECRESFIRFPIPKWLWLFAGAIGIIVLFSLFTFPKSIAVGVALERGEKAERQHRYMTAQKELEKVVEKVPDLLEARGRLLVAAFYNNDMKTMYDMYEKLQGRNIEDQNLLTLMDDVVEKAGHYVPSDSIRQETRYYDSLDIAPPDTLLARLAYSHPDDIAVRMLYAGTLFNKSNYKTSDSVVQLVLGHEYNYMPALAMESSMQRELGNYAKSLDYCERLLDINQESSFALASKSRTYLKLKKDKEALQLALKAREINEKDGYAITSLVLAYHYNNNIAKRDELINRYKNDSTAAVQLSFALDVISKKQHFRD